MLGPRLRSHQRPGAAGTGAVGPDAASAAWMARRTHEPAAAAYGVLFLARRRAWGHADWTDEHLW